MFNNTDLFMTHYNVILDLVTSYFGDKAITPESRI